MLTLLMLSLLPRCDTYCIKVERDCIAAHRTPLDMPVYKSNNKKKTSH